MTCTVFDASHNDISEIPENIGQMKNLEVLNMNDNRLNGLPAVFFRLHIVYLLTNKEIGEVQTLRELHLANNKLFFYPLTPALGKLKGLHTLILRNNQLDEICSEVQV